MIHIAEFFGPTGMHTCVCAYGRIMNFRKMNRYWKSGIEYFSRRRGWILLLMCFAVLLSLLYIGFAINAAVDHDEVEHSHAAFRMLNNEIPYRDFYQNHMPTYWFLNMLFLRAFPFSIHSIIAARFFNLLALAGCWLFGLRLLGSIRGGRTWFGLSIYTCAMITLACEMLFHEARPDPIMALTGTIGLCMIPVRGNISGARALLLGIIFGFSASVSPKILPMMLVVPALIALHCIRDRRFQPAPLITYSLGVVSGLLPTIWWIIQNGLLDRFLFDVVHLNLAVSKPWYRSFAILNIPIYIGSVLGTVVLVWTCRRRLNKLANGPLVVSLAIIGGIVLALMARHPNRYHIQILIVPIAVGFVSLVLHLCLRRRLSYQLLLCTALLGYPAFSVADLLAGIRGRGDSVPQREMQMIIDLAKPGNRTCTAFAPTHPIFCHDVSGISKGWDLSFVEQLKDPQQLERFHRLWREGIQNTLDRRPDIILRRSSQNIWEHAEDEGLITPEELSALDALRPAYQVRYIGGNEIWVRQSNE